MTFYYNSFLSNSSDNKKIFKTSGKANAFTQICLPNNRTAVILDALSTGLVGLVPRNI